MQCIPVIVHFSLPDERENVTEDSGVHTKSTSSSHSNDSEPESSQCVWSPVPVNSHLMSNRVITAQQWQSMSDLRLTEAEIRSRRTLAHIMDELMQTERDYVMSLKLVAEKYIGELDREDVPQSLRGKRGVIFGNVERIYNFHTNIFLKELKECENQPFKISQCFLDHVSSLDYRMCLCVRLSCVERVYVCAYVRWCVKQVFTDKLSLNIQDVNGYCLLLYSH